MHRIEGANNEAFRFTEGPPATTLTANWANAVQEEIANVIEGAGLVLRSASNETYTQLFDAIRRLAVGYDYVVSSQATFNTLLTRVAANQYRINSQYKSVLIRNITGGYSMTPALSGGDAWGYIETNNCGHLVMENGAYINFANERGYIEVNTDDCLMENIYLKGTGTVAAAITQSFYLNASRVTYRNCKSSDRLSNTDFYIFNGSGTAIHNLTSKYVNCSCFDIVSSGVLYGFENCKNINNCIAYNIESTGDVVSGFEGCVVISNSYAYNVEGSSASITRGFYNCSNITSCFADTIVNSSTAQVRAFDTCNLMTSCVATNITAAGSTATGFNTCDDISACKAITIDGTSITYGFRSCDRISACSATDIDSSGATAYGFENCNYGAAIWTDEALNANNDWIDTVDASITNKVSTPSVWT